MILTHSIIFFQPSLSTYTATAAVKSSEAYAETPADSTPMNATRISCAKNPTTRTARTSVMVNSSPPSMAPAKNPRRQTLLSSGGTTMVHSVEGMVISVKPTTGIIARMGYGVNPLTLMISFVMHATVVVVAVLAMVGTAPDVKVSSSLDHPARLTPGRMVALLIIITYPGMHVGDPMPVVLGRVNVLLGMGRLVGMIGSVMM